MVIFQSRNVKLSEGQSHYIPVWYSYYRKKTWTMILTWYFHGIPMIFPWWSHDTHIFPWYFHGIPIVFPWYSMVFPLYSHCMPMIFEWHSHDIPMKSSKQYSQCISRWPPRSALNAWQIYRMPRGRRNVRINRWGARDGLFTVGMGLKFSSFWSFVKDLEIQGFWRLKKSSIRRFWMEPFNNAMTGGSCLGALTRYEHG